MAPGGAAAEQQPSIPIRHGRASGCNRRNVIERRGFCGVIVAIIGMPHYNRVLAVTYPCSEGGHMSNFNQILAELRSERNRAQQEIQNLDAAIRTIQQLGEASCSGIGYSGRKTTHKISAAGRARIAAAQRARWAKVRQARNSKPKRTLSQAARQKIAAAQRARWAKQKAEQKNTA